MALAQPTRLSLMFWPHSPRLHVLFPRIAALCRDAATPGFMVPMRAQKRIEAFHEPPIGARTAMSARIKSKELADKAVRAPVRRRFMAPTHVQFLEVFAPHEPEEHPTSKTQRRTPNGIANPRSLRRSMFDVGRSIFFLGSGFQRANVHFGETSHRATCRTRR